LAQVLVVIAGTPFGLSLQFGAAVRTGRVNDCEILQGPPSQLFASTGIAAERLASLLLRCKIFRGLYESQGL
jgi:hypothetical protein